MMSKVDLSDFQKRFLLGQGAGQTLFTAKEFEEALAQSKGEIMAIAIQTTKQALLIERDECARILEEEMAEQDTAVRGVLEVLAERIRNRIPSQRQ
jgi:hypothetical protein